MRFSVRRTVRAHVTPSGRLIDGIDQSDVLFGKSAGGHREHLLTFVGPEPGRYWNSVLAVAIGSTSINASSGDCQLDSKYLF
jgi:hypothetical protein